MGVERLNDILGRDVMGWPSDEQVRRAGEWRASEKKRRWEFFFGGFMICVLGGPAYALGKVLGYYPHSAGWLTSEGMKMWDHPKLRTQANGETLPIWEANFARDTGLDEIPQIAYAVRGKLSLISDRAYKIGELVEMAAMDVDWLVRYKEAMTRFKMKPGLFGPYDALGGKEACLELKDRMKGNIVAGGHVAGWMDEVRLVLARFD